MNSFQIAPELQTSQWFNTEQAITLASLRGRVVLIEAFQMLCPGCVSHGLPQATRVFESFPQDQIQVLGLHTVFEHHEANSAASLEAFLFEYRIRFPVAIDLANKSAPTPVTMSNYRMRGTPSLILIDRTGHLRYQHFGSVPDLQLGAEIMALLLETSNEDQTIEQSKTRSEKSSDGASGCDQTSCPAPEIK